MKKDISIIMGSINDKDIMTKAFLLLDKFEIGYEKKIISAHRALDSLCDYVDTLEIRGFKVIIAAAGGAAALPGVIAAMTVLPVIGVPIKSASFNGIDSLLSIVQMPAGVPVATVAVNGATNAAVLAVQMLALFNPDIENKLRLYKEDIKTASLKSGKDL
ncbi:MAG: 5-(carboxyamino)imidazole ribonucleotide mutase [Bacilli bacterium]|nr:5-(carboxyamino)imidazole ribonucleotide mutase [Bacilli bacterium]MDD4076717.1 5-(carboxyamino)imidazole ribonucleotide mutase [Bacilli bacterium]MDD4387692.1 5-(carboxyamino)imidazole ribonucleotide mutase [Bacilli bacterium]